MGLILGRGGLYRFSGIAMGIIAIRYFGQIVGLRESIRSTCPSYSIRVYMIHECDGFNLNSVQNMIYKCSL